MTGKGRTYPFRDEGGKVCNRRSLLIDRRRAKVWISMSQPPLIQRRSRLCEQFHPKCDTSSKSECLIWAATPWERARPSHRQAAHHLGLQLDLLGYGNRVVYLDAEIAHRAFQLRVPEKQLHGAQVARFLMYLCRLGSSHRMRAIGRAIKPSARDPRMDDPGILPGRQVR